MHLIPSLLIASAATALTAADYVWWEGEAATEHTFTNQNFPAAWYGDKAQGLSGGDWLNTGGKTPEGGFKAAWTVEVPSDGTWYFHTRKFWKHGPFRWRFGQGEWQTCGKDCGLLDSYTLATHIGANWVSLGRVDLTKGTHRFEVEILSQPGEDLAACFDCFVLSKAPFEPKGKLKPGERYNLAAEGWWAFEPAPDAFGSDAILDLRSLNESVAGEKGFIQAKGDGFIDGAGKPIRFWAVNTGHALLELDDASIDYFAARMAKMGVNLVRLHGAVCKQDSIEADPHIIDRLQYTVQALKKQGIYSHLSTFFPLWMQVRPAHGIPGYENLQNKHPFGLMYFDPRMQELYKSWSKALLTTVDPRTGTTLATDPAVAIYEIINEDSLFFWTFSKRNVGASQWQALQDQFTAWAATTYGSVTKAKEAWSGENHPDDSAERLGLYDPWNLTADGLSKAGPGGQARAKAQARFYAETQRAYYAEMSAWLKKECGLKSTISASNWTTADNGTLGALERWSYAATDVIDRHGYFGGEHKGDGAGYSVRVGHTYQDRCALLDPADLPIKFNQIAGKPHIISEIAWNKPNRYIADNTMVLSSYAALQGIDGIIVFATGSGLWASDGGGKWTINMPGEGGQFPAAALTYRLGLVRTADPVFRQVLSTEDLWNLKGTGLGEGRNSDFRTAGTDQSQAAACDPLAFYVGTVDRSFSAGDRPVATDLKPYHDPAAKTVRSVTGELNLDYGQGILRINAPASRGVSGHLAKAGTVALGDASIVSDLDYGSIWIVALDAKPLAESKRILVQSFSEERMYGWKASNGKIEDIGQAPINVKRLSGTVTLPGRLSGQVLDEHGYARGPAQVEAKGATTVLTIPADSLYVVLTR